MSIIVALRKWTFRPQLAAVLEENKRCRGHNRGNACQQRHGPVHSDAFEHRPCRYDHAPCDQVTGHCDARESDCRMLRIAVDDVLVAADVNRYQHDAEDKAGAQAGPYRYAGVVGPAQPTEGDGEQWSSHDGRPESVLGLDRRTTHVAGFLAGRAVKYGRAESESRRAGRNGSETYAGEAVRQSVCLLEDEVEAGEEGEEKAVKEDEVCS